MGLAPSLLNKPIRVTLVGGAGGGGAGDAADPLVVQAVLGSATDERVLHPLTVLQGEQTSSVAVLGVDTAVGLVFPAALTSTAATIQASTDGATWVTVKNTDGTAYSLTVAASFGVPLDTVVMFPWSYVRVVMGTAEAAARAITLVARPL